MPTIAKKIVAVAAVCAIAALSAQAESPVAAENGIRLSEWGNSPVLPEVESSAPARKAEAESVLPELGEFLSEEWHTLGAGATDADRLRKALANRATGRADDSLMSFMTSRWESAPGRLANFLTDHAETRLNAMPGIENAALDLTPARDGDGFGFSASGVGVLHSSASVAFGIQPKIERASEDGILRGSFGAFQRKAIGGAVVGVNAFADFTSHPVRGEASRWRFGADFASPWVDANVQKYVGGLGERYYHGGELHQAYAPHGTAAEIRVHSPDLRWLEGFARFSETEGRGGNADTRTHGFGLAFQPHFGGLSGWRTNAEWTGDLNVALNYAWTLGEGAALPSLSEPFGVYTKLLDPNVVINDTTIHEYQIYETAALHESNIGFNYQDLPLDKIERRLELSWKLIPWYLRVENKQLMRGCPPSAIPVVEISDSWLTMGDSRFNPHALCSQLIQDWDIINRPITENTYGDYVGMTHLHALMDKASTRSRYYRRHWLQNLSNYHPHYTRAPVWDAFRLLILWGEDANAIVSDDHSEYAGHTPLDIFQKHFGHWQNYETYADYRAANPDIARSSSFPALDLWIEREKYQLSVVARILKIQGGKCMKQDENVGYCAIEVEDLKMLGMKEYIVPTIPPGSLDPVSDINVFAGHEGEIGRIQSNTEYADVNFSVASEHDYFDIGNAGNFSDDAFITSGHNRMRYDLTGESKVGIISITASSVPPGRYVLTIEAKFFAHLKDVNTVSVEVVVNVVENQRQFVKYTELDGTAEFTYEPASFLVNPALSQSGPSSNLSLGDGFNLALTTPLEVGDSTSASFDLTADNLDEAIRLDYTVEFPDYDSKPYVDYLVPTGCDAPSVPVNSPRVNGILLHAVETKDEHMACFAIENSADVNYESDGVSMLNLAIRNGAVPVQRVLIVAGARLTLRDTKVGHPLNAAAEVTDIAIGKFLLRSPLINVDDGATDNLRAIHSLGKRSFYDTGEDKEFADLLVEYNVDVDAITSQKWTYLHYVGKHGQYASMPPILDEEPNPHLLTDGNRLPLAIAVENEWNGVIDELLSNASDLELLVNKVEDETFKAAIHYVYNGEDLDLLMCAGADLFMEVGGDNSVLHNGETAKNLIETRFNGSPRDERALKFWLDNPSSETDSWCDSNHLAIFNNRPTVASL